MFSVCSETVDLYKDTLSSYSGSITGSQGNGALNALATTDDNGSIYYPATSATDYIEFQFQNPQEVTKISLYSKYIAAYQVEFTSVSNETNVEVSIHLLMYCNSGIALS